MQSSLPPRALVPRQHRAHRLGQRGGDGGFGQQLDFALRRMHVDIYRVGRQVNENRGERVPAAREEGAVGCFERVGQAARCGGAAVDEEGHLPPAGPV